MSRTIRRKNEHFLEGLWVDPNKLHRDNHSGDWTPPKSFRKSLNRIKRRKANKKLEMAVTNDNLDNFSVDKWKNDAGWLYW